MPTAPEIIAIDHDDHYASHVGHTHSGHQFFLTTPFVPPFDDSMPGREFIAVFLFERDGTFIEARIDELGSREDLDEERVQELFEKRLHELGEIEYRRIMVRPFQIERFGTIFGLVASGSGLEGDDWWVTLEPGDYMAFHEPWDSGIYDT